MRLTNSTKEPKEDKLPNTTYSTEETKYKFSHAINIIKKITLLEIVKLMWRRKKYFTLERLRRLKTKKEKLKKAFVAQVGKDHQVWSSGDEDDENDNKKKRVKSCIGVKKVMTLKTYLHD